MEAGRDELVELNVPGRHVGLDKIGLLMEGSLRCPATFSLGMKWIVNLAVYP